MVIVGPRDIGCAVWADHRLYNVGQQRHQHHHPSGHPRRIDPRDNLPLSRFDDRPNVATTVMSDDATFVTASAATAGVANDITNIQVVTRASTSVVISWTTATPSTSRVLYGKTSRYGLQTETKTLTTSHRVTLKLLTPKTTYHFRLVSSGATASVSGDTAVTTTAPPPGHAIAPTVLSVRRPARTTKTITVFGIMRGNHAVAIFIDGKVQAQITIPGTAALVRTFTKTIQSSLLTRGRHTITTQATDSVGRTSIIRQRVTVRF